MSSETPRRVALITGAARGIGRAISLRLASDGFNVALNDLPKDADALDELVKEIESSHAQHGRKVVKVLGDVSKEDDVKDMVETVSTELGGLDVMVANAGIALVKPFVEITADEFDSTMAVNARGVFLCYKYAALQMIKQGKERGGRIIGASSGFGRAPGLGMTAYSASKYAVRSLTQSLALELGKHNINVTAYAPGYIDTPMVRSDVPPGVPVEMAFAQLSKDFGVLGRLGQPEEIANLVSFLASKQSSFMTGETIGIDGGAVGTYTCSNHGHAGFPG